ncbi:Lrp/AsnC family transcriptional regulator [Terasakiella sp. A23]|uniref:Lrp/AsnC family transcriptional regulator n=1 Tax=Terasakiella sp. FCG-A23 TaxID=3080561 RepID=UPI002953471B|nr:Lrp/AsnC family transcriptional regulator [Terasakiella sp. A23]MDV7340674.1 Lrp/AsnC family transcriptional regulator [Terasakiella sp. A23]
MKVVVRKMDDLDRKLIAELRVNGRASTPKLAQILGVARGTVQTRLDKLISSGVIKSFTIRLRDAEATDMIRAIMLVELGEHHYAKTMSTIKKIPGFKAVHTTNGRWDLVAELEVSSMAEMNLLVSKVRGMDGVRKSETSILLGPA